MERKRPTLDQLFLLFLLLTVCLLGGLFWFLNRSSKTVVERSAKLLLELERTHENVGREVSRYFDEAARIILELDSEEYVSMQLHPDAILGRVLKAQLESVPDISEVTFVSADPPGQLTVYRDETGKVEMSQVVKVGGVFREVGSGLERSDPTLHPTYRTLTGPGFKGETLWSDLHYSQLDALLPPEKRRVVVTAQKAVYGEGRLLGLLRVGRFIDALTQVTQRGGEADAQAGKWVFLADRSGRLVTTLPGAHEVVETSGDLRISAGDAPPEVRRTLEEFAKLPADRQDRWLATHRVGGAAYLSLFQPLKGSQDWMIGVVVPESYFLGSITRVRDQLLLASLVIFVAVVALGALVLKMIHKDIRHLVSRTRKMGSFDFEPEEFQTRVFDLHQVEYGLESSKSSLRALSKYVPVDLVKKLYDKEIEPKLGGQLRCISILFTDVAGFTTVAEKLTNDELAAKLADYLDRMNNAIERNDGALLERVGDALLSIWNAPTDCPGYSLKVCRAALDCIKATEDLDWDTRYGLHQGEVLVGHFGSENRMNYGLLGDDVNLASRIEGLNKHYGTRLLASESVVKEADGSFEFRLIDEVAVKGRSSSVKLYELLGVKGEVEDARLQTKKVYEEAFALYQQGRFQDAAALLSSPASHDFASRTLKERCESYLSSAPPAGWNGVFVATFK